MMKFLIAAIAAVSGAAFAAVPTATAGDSADVLIVNGRDTLILNSSAAVSYEEYLRHKCPLVLVAHESGGWVTAAMGPNENCDTTNVDFRRYIRAALAECDGGERYGECWVIAIGRNIVWNGPIKFRKGKWTPRSEHQFSVTLSAEYANTTSGMSPLHTVGLLNYHHRNTNAARMTFKDHPVLGTCNGDLNLVEGKPSPFTVTCSKVGVVTGQFDVNPDGRTGSGSGSGAKNRHFDLTVLPHIDVPAKQRVAKNAAQAPQS